MAASMKKVFITGINGFSGRHLKEYLEDKEVEIYGIGRQASSPLTHIKYFECDILDKEKLVRILSQVMPDYIFHLAGVMFSNTAEDFYRSNIIGSLNVFSATTAITDYHPSILSVGSAAEYGPSSESELPIAEDKCPLPVTHYGISKLGQMLNALLYVRKYRVRINMVRTFNLVGEGMSGHLVVADWAKQVAEIERGMREPEIKVGDLNSTRDFIDIKEAVKLYWEAINFDEFGEIYNVCSGKPVRIKSILDYLVGKSTKSISVCVDRQRIREGEGQHCFGDNSKLKDASGLDISVDCLPAIDRVYESALVSV